jgi:hypothetical protein
MAFSTACTFIVWQPYASNVAATTPTGGAWAANTYSFLIRAWYTSAETDLDAGGNNYHDYAMSGSQCVVNGVVVAANDQVILTWDAARIQPDHYSVYVQAAATWSYPASSSTRLGQVAGHLLTATFNDGSISGAALPAQEAPTIVSVNGAKLLPQERDMLVVGHNGIMVPRSFAFSPVQMPGGLGLDTVSPLSGVTIQLPRAACTKANRDTLLKWRDNAWPVILRDDNEAAGRRYQYYHGAIVSVDTLNTTAHESQNDWAVTMRLDGVYVG